MKLTYHPAAKAEIVEAVAFFADIAPGTGGGFFLEVEHCLRLVTEFPEQNRILEPEIRLLTLPRHPYVIYYRIHYPDIHILAFKKHPRHPDFWRYKRA